MHSMSRGFYYANTNRYHRLPMIYGHAGGILCPQVSSYWVHVHGDSQGQELIAPVQVGLALPKLFIPPLSTLNAPIFNRISLLIFTATLGEFAAFLFAYIIWA